MKELRAYLFPDLMTETEAFNEEIEFDKSKHLLTDDNLDIDILDLIVNNIFRKAQEEKLFCIFYGQICEEIIILELKLRGLSTGRAHLKHSKFRKSLFEVCKNCFEKFFDPESKEQQN